MCYNFSLNEIREQLAVLGYHDVPVSKLCEFKRDLDQMTMLADEELEQGDTLQVGGADSYPEPIKEPLTFSVHGSKEPATFSATHEAREPLTFSPIRMDNGARTYQVKEPLRVPGMSGDIRTTVPIFDEDFTGEDDCEEETFVSSITPTQPLSARPSMRLRLQDSERPRQRQVLRKVVRRDDSGSARRVDEISYTEEVSSLTDTDDTVSCVSLSAPPSARSAGLIQGGRGHPHTRNIRKTDPVSKYHAYRQQWESQRAPGERNHRQLRWAVKEAMMIHEVPVRRASKPQQANNYVPPTDKKRKNLRWQIRQDMAQFSVPMKSNPPRL